MSVKFTANVAGVTRPSQIGPSIADAGEQIVDDAVLVLKKPREHQAGQHRRHRPRQQQRYPHEPAPAGLEVGDERQRQPYQKRADDAHKDNQQRDVKRVPETRVVPASLGSGGDAEQRPQCE